MALRFDKGPRALGLGCRLLQVADGLGQHATLFEVIGHHLRSSCSRAVLLSLGYAAVQQPPSTRAQIALHDLADEIVGELIGLAARLEQQPRLTARLRQCEHLVLRTRQHGAEQGLGSCAAYDGRHPQQVSRPSG